MMTDEELKVALDNLPGERVTEEYMRDRIETISYDRISPTVMICNIVLDNGYSVRGESACVDPVNFNHEIGQKISYDNAFGKLWPLFGFLLAEARYVRK